MAITPPNQGVQLRAGVSQAGTADLEHARMTLAFLGKFFGSGSNAATNIAGLVIIVSFVVCVLVLFVETKVPAGDAFKALLPIITLALGYLFGSRGRE